MTKRADVTQTTDCVADNLRRAARVISRDYDNALRPYGINVGQFAILARLSALEESVAEIAVSELADDLAMDRTTLTRNLRPLTRANLVHLTSGSDRRKRIVGLTRQGRTKFRDSFAAWKGVQKRVVNAISKDSWRTVKSELHDIIEHLS